ncbi:MAG: hypothetical protein ACT4OX_15890 [Actinomycetota bacterium]
MFATRFEELPEVIDRRADYRVLISAGVLVRAVAVVGQLTPDGFVELLSITLDTSVD